jgi:hypothetical protein
MRERLFLEPNFFVNEIDVSNLRKNMMIIIDNAKKHLTNTTQL